MAGLDQEQDPTRENVRHEAVRVLGPDAGLRLLRARIAEQCRDEVRGALRLPRGASSAPRSSARTASSSGIVGSCWRSGASTVFAPTW